MTFSVSIGDAFLMAKIALRIGQALSKGMNSAPAQIRELESLLYSLSAALDAVGTAHKGKSVVDVGLLDYSTLPRRAPPQFVNSQGVLLGVMQSCRETLGHLEAILDRYGEVSDVADRSSESLPKRWGRGLKTNWKKIIWTTEGGDLAELKSTLTVYTNSLNLILVVVTNNQANQLKSDLGEVSNMLLDIHSWFVENIQNSSKAASSSSARETPSSANSDEPPTLRFELYQQTGQQARVICPAATCSLEGLEMVQSYLSGDVKLFSCTCADGDHRAVVGSYRMSPMSFAARIAGGESSWLVHAVSSELTDQLSSLVIKKITVNAIRDFEEFLIRSFDIFQAKHMFQRALNMDLINVSDIEKHGSRANVIDVIGSAQNVYRSFKGISFTLEAAQLRQSAVDSVQIFHYKSIALGQLIDGSILGSNAFEPHKDAEVSIHIGSTPGLTTGGLFRSILKLRWNTEIQRNNDLDTVSIKDVECTAYNEEEIPISTIRATVVFELKSPADAGAFHTALEAVRMELFIIHLQYPRTNETPLLQIQAKDVHTDRMLIRDADLMILRDTSTEQCRLLLRSRQGSAIVSQELKKEFFDVLVSKGYSDYGAPTYEVFVDESGKRRVRQYSKGFSYMSFSHSEIDQVYKMGLSALQGAEKRNLAIRAKD